MNVVVICQINHISQEKKIIGSNINEKKKKSRSHHCCSWWKCAKPLAGTVPSKKFTRGLSSRVLALEENQLCNRVYNTVMQLDPNPKAQLQTGPKKRSTRFRFWPTESMSIQIQWDQQPPHISYLCYGWFLLFLTLSASSVNKPIWRQSL